MMMAASLVRTARSVGIPPEGIHRLSRAHALAMQPRLAALEDEHHPLFLHPGRTVLVLLRDVSCVDAALLAAAALVESEDAELRVAAPAIRDAFGCEIAELVAAVPTPGTASLAEALVTADERVRLLALAERLDHLRHAHLREADERWRIAAHAEAVAIYGPVAERTHPRLARRYAHWCGAFAKRLERG
jgi:(p)ppGpp synthase/HD superfamily hydrolase